MATRVKLSLQVPSFPSVPENGTPQAARSDQVTQVAQSHIGQYNGEFREIEARENLYLAIDGSGGVRQGWEVVVNSLVIAQTAGGPVATSAVASVGVCLLSGLCTTALGITGVANTYIALRWWLQDAKAALKGNREKLAMLEQMERLLRSPEELAKLESTLKDQPELQKALQCLIKMGGKKIDKEDLSKMKEELAEAVKIAALSVTCHKLYAAMGVAQTNLATVTMLTDVGGKAFHYTPVLAGTGATVASSVSTMALGLIYIVRGGYMYNRASKSYTLVKNFRDEFNQSKNIDDAMRLMRRAEQRNAVDSNLNRRVNEACLKEINGTYTADGFKPDTGELVPYANDKEKLEYLQRVDKGLYTEELKQTIAQKIAKAMIVGGAFALIAGAVGLLVLLLSNPAGLAAIAITIAVIGLISAVFFCGVEYIFLTYDSSKLFARFRDYKYKPAQWIKNIEEALAKKPVEQSKEKPKSDNAPKPVDQSKKEKAEPDYIKQLDEANQNEIDELNKWMKETLALVEQQRQEILAAYRIPA